MTFDHIISSCRLLSVNLTIKGDWWHMQKWQQWFHPLGLYPLSYFLSLACHSYILGWLSCFGMYGHGGFRWPHFSVSAVHHLYCCLSFPYSILPCIPQDSLDVLWHDGHIFGSYGVEIIPNLTSCSFLIMYIARQFRCPLAWWSHVWHVWCRGEMIPTSSVFSSCFFFTTDSARMTHFPWAW